jgi:hypothetical protein
MTTVCSTSTLSCSSTRQQSPYSAVDECVPCEKCIDLTVSRALTPAHAPPIIPQNSASAPDTNGTTATTASKVVIAVTASASDTNDAGSTSANNPSHSGGTAGNDLLHSSTAGSRSPARQRAPPKNPFFVQAPDTLADAPSQRLYSDNDGQLF